MNSSQVPIEEGLHEFHNFVKEDRGRIRIGNCNLKEIEGVLGPLMTIKNVSEPY